MTVVIVALGFADGKDCPHAGQYLERFDFEHENGLGFGEFTHDLGRAKRFVDKVDAYIFYHTVPKCRPRRDDGRANRPLTALTAELREIDA